MWGTRGPPLESWVWESQLHHRAHLGTGVPQTPAELRRAWCRPHPAPRSFTSAFSGLFRAPRKHRGPRRDLWVDMRPSTPVWFS